jgi:hypothetical protein
MILNVLADQDRKLMNRIYHFNTDITLPIKDINETVSVS